MSLTRRLLSFSTIPAFSALIPFVILPVLARAAGADAWVAIAVGQSVGGFLALAVGLGLNVSGPTLVALAAADERAELFARGTRARLALTLPALVIGSVVAGALAPPAHALSAALMAVAITLGGLTASWYLIGLGTPLPLIGFELVPRAVATAIGAVIVVVGGPVWAYPVLLIAAIIGGVAAYALRVVRPRDLVTGWAASGRFARRQLSAAATETVSGAYTALAVSLVTAGASTSQAATYVSGDKLWRMGQTVVGAQGNALQGWVVEDDRAHFAARARRALLLHAALGAVGFACFAILGPWLTGVAFGADVAIDRPTAVLFGVATFCVSMSTATGRHVLIAWGRPRLVFASVVAGAIVGIPTTLALAGLHGAAGGATGLAAAEAIVLIMQVGMILVERRKVRR
ncbi:lipopolysaccharide biosynthesis protein [Microbacterium sp. G2-8]|uniref:lipopolysaccharide biosynthesis protein n=1 Tax=Microbacterium sp. G2-8 TaxID=2842454 RepID=UPI001C89034F|nr:polysaccharide biosynthesis protein [Microbacterium sp. G2-8]